MASEFGDLNAVGETKIIGRMGSTGGNSGRGPLDNVLPTGIVAEGDEPTARDVMYRGVRADMSVAKNRSISKKSMGSNR